MDMRIIALSLLFLSLGYPISINAQEAEPSTETPLVNTEASSTPAAAADVADVTDHPHPDDHSQPAESDPNQAPVTDQPPEQQEQHPEQQQHQEPPAEADPEALHRTQPTHLPPAPDAEDNHVHPEELGGYPEPAHTAQSDIPVKTSVQSTFKFGSEERCFHFLKRLKSKGKNEHSDHPLTCGQAFDGLLCWRPADPGETLLQVCPDGPTNTRSYAKRECVNGRWRDYGNVNENLVLRGIKESDYTDCMQVPSFVRKHAQLVRQDLPAPHSAELQPGQGGGVREYGFSSPAPTIQNQEHPYGPRPEEQHTTAATYDPSASIAPPKPWNFVDVRECEDLLKRYGFETNADGSGCRGNHDGKMCWPATAAGTEAHQPCRRPASGQDPSQIPQATRYCGTDGTWNASKSDGSIAPDADPVNNIGWTNYEACDAYEAALAAAVSAAAAAANAVTEAPIAGAGVAGQGIVLKPDANTTAIPVAEVTTEAAAVTGSTMALTSNAGAAVQQAMWRLIPAQCDEMLKRNSQLEPKEAGGCRGGTDGNICWPAANKNSEAMLQCPQMIGLDQSKKISRKCDANGAWTKASYVDCLTAEIKDVVQHDYHLLHPSSAPKTLALMLPLVFLNFLITVFL